MECEESGFLKQSWLAAWLSCKFQLRGNWTASLYFLFCSAPAGMTLQLLACLARVQLLAACKPRATHEIRSQVLVSLHNLEHFFTFSHTLPLHESHLNIGLLITKIQANLVQNKTNKMVDKIQPYNFLLVNFCSLLYSNYSWWFCFQICVLVLCFFNFPLQSLISSFIALVEFWFGLILFFFFFWA